MLSSPLSLPPPGPDGVREQGPGRPAMDHMVEVVAGCLGYRPGDSASMQTVILIWQQLHGLVSLRITRPLFPWPPLADTVTDAVGRLLAGAPAATSPTATSPTAPATAQPHQVNS